MRRGTIKDKNDKPAYPWKGRSADAKIEKSVQSIYTMQI